MTIPFFSPTHMPDTQNEYVCWLDVSGTKSTLSRSIKAGAVSIFKLHDAILNFKNSNVNIYPVMDGAYITSQSKSHIIEFVNNVFKVMAECLIDTEVKYRFFIKASTAFGPVIHGKDIPDEASFRYGKNTNYKSSLLLGMPMIQAASSESLASPFGVYIHESARAFSPNSEESFITSHWQWFKSFGELGEKTMQCLNEYFDWCKRSSDLYWLLS